MKTLRKLFFGIRMTWVRVIGFAVATAVITATVLLIPGLDNTSFQNIGVTFEWWILFALIVILNCEKPLEAGTKVFVFFLISQPLIYLIQVPFSSLGWGLFRYYPRWFVMTLLCFPGGMIAWYVKKGNVWSALILSVATGFLALECVSFVMNWLHYFPHQLLASVFTAMLAVALIFVLLEKKRCRWIAGACLALSAAASCFVLLR